MADTIQLRAGNKANMPSLAERELAYVKDEKALYVGTPEGNVKADGGLGAKQTELETKQTEQATKLTEMETKLKDKLEATRAASMEPLASDADLAAVVSKVNELIEALKAANIMTT